MESGLSGTASRADTLPMIEGKLAEGEQKPSNVQVRLLEEEETFRVIELNEEGSFLRVEIGPVDEAKQPPAIANNMAGADRGMDGGLEDAVTDQLREAQAQNEALAREVIELTVKLEWA